MTAVMQRYKTALVLMIETTPFDYRDTAEQKTAHQNVLTEQLIAKMQADGLTDLLMMGAGPLEACALACQPIVWTRRKWPTLST